MKRNDLSGINRRLLRVEERLSIIEELVDNLKRTMKESKVHE